MSKRTTKACQVCGRSFLGASDYFYCPDCAKAKKSASVIKIRTCLDCGIEFLGGPRARRCPACSHSARIHYNRKPTARPLGSLDDCILCGKEYVVASGRQKYCPDCKKIGVLEWQKEHKKGYSRESGQYSKKSERRKLAKKICAYCLRTFSSNTSSNTCSDYCRTEHAKLLQCKADIKRGKNRLLEKYEEKREKYRKECQNDR